MTQIEWCDEVWNPVTGCSPVGAGCLHCWARTMAHRFPDNFGGKAEPFKVTCHSDRLNAKVLRKRKPQRIFVCSMGDLYHAHVPDRFRHSVFGVEMLHPQHTFIHLTKRIKTAARFHRGGYYLAEHVWLGVSVSTQREADERIPILLQCSAAKRIVSYEPALDVIPWHTYFKNYSQPASGDDCSRIDWLICGCESGPKRRPFDEDWARFARDVCIDNGVPFFYKQGRGKQNRVVKMPLLDGRRWGEYPC